MNQTEPQSRLVNAALQRNKLSFRWLASRMKVSHVTVGKWLNGDSSPRHGSVWNEMLVILRDYEQDKGSTGDVSLRKVGLRQIPVYAAMLPGQRGPGQTVLKMLDVKDWGNDRSRWGRVIDGRPMYPLLEPGDIVIFEERPFEPGNVVHIQSAEEDLVRVARGYGEHLQYLPVNQEFPPLPAKGWEVLGVAVGRVRTFANDESETREYPHGMNHRIEMPPRD